MLTLLAWRNLWRNRSRSFITMASVWCAVVLAVALSSLQKGVFDHLIANVVSFYSGYVQVHHAGYQSEQTLENSFPLTDSVRQAVLSAPGVVHATPRLEAFALVSTGEKTRGCMVAGIEPDGEDRVTHLKSKLVAGAFLHERSTGVLLAEGLAKRLRVGPGDTVVLLGQGYYGSTAAGKYAVEGLLRFGSPALNDQVVFLALATAQHWLDAPDLVTTLVVSPRKPAETESVAAGLRRTLPADFETLSWQEMMPDIREHIQTDTASSAIIKAVLYLLIAFGIFATLLMMLAERQREFGMLVALGMKKIQLARVVLFETIFITITGCLVGIAVSIPLVWWLKEHPIRFSGETAEVYERFGFEAVFPAALSPSIFVNQAVAVFIVGVLLSFYPVIKVLSINPVEAMRS
ncbi:MAG: ABC transporter permease [Saprospiraceae bacterium]|jgi:putative ABC transport system permease protein|nr:ABC transporter permease [Saprospiraceae bacterium]